MIEKTKTIRELGAVDVSSLKRLVQGLSEDVWTAQDAMKENTFFCFHSTSHIVFRFIRGNRDPHHFYDNQIWNFWRDQLLPVMDQVTQVYGYAEPEYPKVMLARLHADGTIDRHVDGAGSHLLTHKIHIPLQTNPQARMYVEPEYHQLEEGKAYELNNIVSHGAENQGDTDRIHLIFESFDKASAPPQQRASA